MLFTAAALWRAVLPRAADMLIYADTAQRADDGAARKPAEGAQSAQRYTRGAARTRANRSSCAARVLLLCHVVSPVLSMMFRR